MIFRSFQYFETGCAAHVLGCGRLGLCAVVDPQLHDVDAYPRAATLHESIHAKLLALPDELELYPGHFAGSMCGAGMSGKPQSTIGFEKRYNPLLSMDRATFVAAIVQAPARPADSEQILGFNRGLSA